MNFKELKSYLDKKVKLYNQLDFITLDPICIPHKFTQLQDIEIAGLFAAVFAWGQRTTIINKCNDLLQRMDNAPYQFIVGHTEHDLQKLIGFKHRTFNDTDLLYFISFLNHWYTQHASLETAFTRGIKLTDTTIENGLTHFQKQFFNLPDVPERTRKHISSPISNSACKRINMFLRWMVRKDNTGVDFGVWKKIKTSQLICPLDVHVLNVANQLGLMHTDKANWKSALELTLTLKKFDTNDPVKYDFALFGTGVNDAF